MTCVWYPTFFKLFALNGRNWFSESLLLWRIKIKETVCNWFQNNRNKAKLNFMHVCIQLPSTTAAFSDLRLCVMNKADSSSEESSMKLSTCSSVKAKLCLSTLTTQNDHLQGAIYYASGHFVICMKFNNTIHTNTWNRKIPLTGMESYITFIRVVLLNPWNSN